MANVDGAATIEATAELSGTLAMTYAGRTGGGSSPTGLITRPPLLAEMGKRVLNHDHLDHVILTPEGHLEFWIGATLVAVLTDSSHLYLKGSLITAETESRIIQTPELTTDGVLEHSPSGPSWSFAMKNSGDAVQVGVLGPTGNLTIYSLSALRLPLSAGNSPTFGSDYAVDSGGDTHVTNDLQRTLAKFGLTILEKPGTQVEIDTGWVLPGIASEVADGDTPWSFDDNILVDDEFYAETSLGSLHTSNTMRALEYAFGLNAEKWHRVDGIRVKYSRSALDALAETSKLRVVAGGAEVGDNRASDTAGQWPFILAADFEEIGGASDVWGLTGRSLQYLGSELQASDFGVALAVENKGSTPFTGPARLLNFQMRLHVTSFTPLPHATLDVRSVTMGGI